MQSFQLPCGVSMCFPCCAEGETEARESEYLIRLLWQSCDLVPRFLWVLLHLAGDWRSGHCHIFQMWSGYFYSSGICLFWWPESQEIKDEISECLVTLSKAASLCAPQFPQRETKRVGLGGLLGRCYPSVSLAGFQVGPGSEDMGEEGLWWPITGSAVQG